MSPFALSTCPLACGCATDAKSISIPQSLAQYWNSLAVNGELRSVIILLGMPNLCMMSCMNSTAFSALYLTKGLYAIYFVNLSIATNMYSKSPFAFLSGPT